MFITFEGIEGTGKSTALKGVGEWLSLQGRQVLLTREPGGSELGRVLRSLLLDARSRITPQAELFLYLADRAQHVAEVIRPALDQGRIVVSDRYADSTIVYQGFGRGLDVDELHHANNRAVAGLWPDLTILLDVAPEIGLARARGRNTALGLEEAEGRFEAEAMAFHYRIRQGYLEWAARHKERFCLVDASAAPEQVLRQVQELIATRLEK